MQRAVTASEYSVRTDWLNVSVLSTIFGIWKPLALVVPNMVLSKLKVQKLVFQHTRGRYTFQPLWVSGIKLRCFTEKSISFMYGKKYFFIQTAFHSQGLRCTDW